MTTTATIATQDRQPTRGSSRGSDLTKRLNVYSDPAYISRKIREQITNTSVTVVIIGDRTVQSDWVSKEIAWSLAKNPPNGILGIRLSADAEIPLGLNDCGAEILNWSRPEDVREFRDAIERAALGARRTVNMPTNSVSTCTR